MRIPIGDGFLWFAMGVELGLAGLGLLIGLAIGLDPWRDARPTPFGLMIGTLATLPMLIVLLLCDRGTFAPLRRIRRVLEAVILPFLRDRSLLELALIAGAAGIGEETLFRGLIQGGLHDRIGAVPALLIASVAFGLLHALTIAYAVIAGLIGLYLGALYVWSGDLTVPIVAHGLYDWVALIYFLRTTRGDTIGVDPDPEETTP